MHECALEAHILQLITNFWADDMAGYPEPVYGAAPPSRVAAISPYTFMMPAAGTSNVSLQSSALRTEQISAMKRAIPECKPKNLSECATASE